MNSKEMITMSGNLRFDAGILREGDVCENLHDVCDYHIFPHSLPDKIFSTAQKLPFDKIPLSRIYQKGASAKFYKPIQ